MTDFLVVAEGTVDRHVKALAQNVEEDLKKDQITPMYVEGLQSSDWVVLDYGDMLIHVMTHELREKYALEQLWKEGKIIDTKSL